MAVTKLIQVTNISPAISEEQMLTLFSFVGKIEAMCMYPLLYDLESVPNMPKICYIKFFDAACVGVAQYLTNTVFNDRALVVTPVEDGQIPDEEKAIEMAAQVGSSLAAYKPPDKPKSELVNYLEGTAPKQLIVSHDPRLEELGLPKYPPLPASFEGPVIEEIRRTVLIADINKEVTPEELMHCFEKAGDIKYMKFCSRSDDIRYALIEFTDQTHIINALQMNGLKFRGKRMKVYHSTQAITKPETKSNEVAQREVVEALTRVKEAESLILAAIDPSLSLSKSKKGRSRSKSPRRSRGSRSRRPSGSQSRRRRPNSRSRRSTSRSHQRRLKLKSPRRRKSRSKSPRAKRSSPSRLPARPKRRSRSKSPARAKRRSRTKSPPKSKGSRPLKRSRSRSRPRHRPSPKSKAESSKSTPSRDKSRNESKSHEKKDRDRRNAKNDKDESRRKEGDRGSSKQSSTSSQENGNPSSRMDRESTHKSLSVKQNDDSGLCKDELSISAEHGSEITSSFNQTDIYKENMVPQGGAENPHVCTSQNNYIELKGPNIDFKSDELNGKEHQNVFSSNLQCDSLTVKCCNENQFPHETSGST